MRMRRMKNLEPRMEKCAAYRVAEPAAQKGQWRALKPDCTQLWVEVGCGKGKFTAETAQANPDVLLIAVERCREAMVVAMEKAQAMGLKNVFFIDMDVANMEEVFGPGEIDRLRERIGKLADQLEESLDLERIEGLAGIKAESGNMVRENKEPEKKELE